MQSVRAGRLARYVAAILLLWAGADLANVNLCAIDRLPLRGPASQAVLTGDVAADQTQAPLGADDCFCCSHSAMSVPAFVSAPQVTRNEGVCVPPIQQTHVLHARLDHPPQLV